MAVLITHEAGEIFGNQQSCKHCGQMLKDYTTSTAIGNAEFTFFRPGTIITMTSGGPISKQITGATPCTKLVKHGQKEC